MEKLCKCNEVLVYISYRNNVMINLGKTVSISSINGYENGAIEIRFDDETEVLFDDPTKISFNEEENSVVYSDNGFKVELEILD